MSSGMPQAFDTHVMLEGDRTLVAQEVQLNTLRVRTSPSLGQGRGRNV